MAPRPHLLDQGRLASSSKFQHAHPVAGLIVKLVDLSEPGADDAWRVVNDGVMGGISESHFLICDAVGVFSGRLLADHNGGFASVRTAIASAMPNDLRSIAIRVRGDGKHYQFRAHTSDRSDMPSYKYSFETKAGQWQDVSIRLTEMEATFRGRRVPDAPALNPSSIRSIGFLIAESQFGSFRLEVESILGSGSG